MEDSYRKLDESIKAIREAEEFLYISMAWWWDDSVGRELFKEVEAAKNKGLDIRVEMRPDPSNEQIENRLSKLKIEVTQIVEFHAKAICTEKKILIMNANYFEKDMLKNINFSAVEVDKKKISTHKKEFLERSKNKALQLDGPELYTNKSKLIKEKQIYELLKWSKLNPLQSKVCRHVLYGEENLLVIAPTGAGKTLIGELALYRSVILKRKKAVWIVPSRALAEEITSSLNRIQSDEIKPIKCLGSEEVSNESLKNSNVWICTTEKFESLLRKQSIESTTYKIDTIVVDEIQFIGEKGRGQVLESILSRYKDRVNVKRLVGLSATLENADEFSGWLNARLLKSSWKPNVLHKEVVIFEADINEKQKSLNEKKNKKLIEIVEEIKKDPNKKGPVIIFCGSKSKCDNRALMLANWNKSKENIYEYKNPLDKEDFIFLMEQRIGLNYSNLSYAEEFKTRYKNKKCDYLFATTGLAQGVNLPENPARHVIILDTVIGKDKKLDLNKAEQMLGRAGRIHESEGWGYLICPSYEQKKWKEQIGIRTSNVNSVIDNHLPDVLLAEFYLENIKCEQDALDFYQGSFKVYQSKKEFKTIAVEIENALDFLLNNDFLERNKNEQLLPTEVGKASIQFMVDTDIAVSLINSCSKLILPSSYREAEKQIIKMLADALPKPNFYNLDFDLEIYIVQKLNNIGISINEEQAIDYISFFAMYLALNEPSEIKKISVNNKELSNFFKQLLEDQCPRYLTWLSRIGKYTRSPWVIYCAFDISRRLKWHNLSPDNFRGSSKLINFLEQLINPEETHTKLPKAWKNAIENDFCTPIKLKKETKKLSFSSNSEAISRRISSLIRKSEIKLLFDESNQQIRLIGLPKDTRTVFAEVFKPNSIKGMTTYISEGREFLISIPLGLNIKNSYKILLSIETSSDRDLFAFEKSISIVNPENKSDNLEKLVKEKIRSLPEIQKISKRKGLIEKIKKKLNINDFDQSELNEWVLAKKQYFVEIVDLINQDSSSLVDRCSNINSTVNKLINLKTSLDSEPFRFRSIPSILKSGEGTNFERELCKLCLASNTGINFGIVMGAGSGAFYSICEINNKWFSFESISNIFPTPVYPNPLEAKRIESIRRNSKNLNNQDIDISWVDGFQKFSK